MNIPLVKGHEVRGQGTGNRGQGTGDREQGTGNRGQGTVLADLFFIILSSKF